MTRQGSGGKGWPKAKETAVAERAQGATEVLTASVAGAERAGEPAARQLWRGVGRPVMGGICGLYHKDNGNLLKCFKEGGEIRFAFF